MVNMVGLVTNQLEIRGYSIYYLKEMIHRHKDKTQMMLLEAYLQLKEKNKKRLYLNFRINVGRNKHKLRQLEILKESRLQNYLQMNNKEECKCLRHNRSNWKNWRKKGRKKNRKQKGSSHKQIETQMQLMQDKKL